MAELASLQGEIPSTYDQLVRQLQCARLTADQLGDPVVTMLLDLVQRRCLTRSPAAGSPRRELATPGTLAPPDSLTVYLFGSFQSFLNGVALNGWHKKGGALFKYLVMHRAVPVHRDKLIDLFWPDADLVAARNCLNVTLHALRRSLQAVSGEHGARALIQFADEHYFLRPELKVWTDAEAFMEEIAHAQAMAKNGDQACAIAHNEVAAALYRADFLEEDRYEEWTISPRQRLRTAYTALLVDLGRLHFDAGNFEAALDHSRKLIERDCCCEDAHFQIMRCYSALGQRVLAAQHYLVSRETLARELGVRPMDAMTRLYEEITAADHNGRAT